ncbi:MAG: VOC family protein [Pseudomonadota bacterium]
MHSNYQGIVPYLFYDDAVAALDWYANHFGFEEIGRWSDAAGHVHNAEMRIGNTELWLDGSGRRQDADKRPVWIGIWVEDVDGMYNTVQNRGIECDAPVTREFGVQMLTVADPFGFRWGFMKRVA